MLQQLLLSLRLRPKLLLKQLQKLQKLQKLLLKLHKLHKLILKLQKPKKLQKLQKLQKPKKPKTRGRYLMNFQLSLQEREDSVPLHERAAASLNTVTAAGRASHMSRKKRRRSAEQHHCSAIVEHLWPDICMHLYSSPRTILRLMMVSR